MKAALLSVCTILPLTLTSLGQMSPPRINSGGVVGAGNSSRQIAPNAIVSIFGENFASPGTARLVSQADLVDGKLPQNLGGVCVEFGTQRARLFHVFSGQLNVQVPSLTVLGTTPVQVLVNCGAATETRSNVEMAQLQATAPEFLFFVQNQDGRNPIAAVNAVTAALTGARDLSSRWPEPRPVFVPAKPGDIISFFATGFGRTEPPFEAGVLPDRTAPTTERVVVTFNSFMGLMTPEILYAGVAPGLAGVYQINVRIPADAPTFNLQVSARVGNVTTAPGAYLTVERP